MVCSKLKLRLFGGLEAYSDGTAINGLHLREGERLLAFLTLRHGAAVSYRQLAQLFWPSEARSNNTLEGGAYPSTRQAVFSLRRALGDEAWRLGSPRKGAVVLDLAGADVDILEFDALVQQGDLLALQRALELYRGQVLAGWSEPWVEPERSRRERSYQRILGELSKHGEEPVSELIGLRDHSPTPVRLEPAGGAVPLESPFYIERSADAEFHEAIAASDSIVLVKGSRQMGKTSLLARGLQRARRSGRQVLLTDFQGLADDALTNANTLYLALAQDMYDQLGLEKSPEESWSDRRSANRNLERYLCDVVLDAPENSLVWGLDEVDRLFSVPFGSEVFGLFRSWHNRRALDPTGPWPRLTLAIAYSSEAHRFITDANQSPFNVGIKVTLTDFDVAHVAELNRRHGEPLRNGNQLAAFMQLVDGHPYLVRRGLAEMVAHNQEVAMLATVAADEDGPFGDHLRRIHAVLMQDPELKEEMHRIACAESCTSQDRFFSLRSLGLVSGSSCADAKPRCNLYAVYLRERLMGTTPG